MITTEQKLAFLQGMLHDEHSIARWRASQRPADATNVYHALHCLEALVADYEAQLAFEVERQIRCEELFCDLEEMTQDYGDAYVHDHVISRWYESQGVDMEEITLVNGQHSSHVFLGLSEEEGQALRQSVDATGQR